MVPKSLRGLQKATWLAFQLARAEVLNAPASRRAKGPCSSPSEKSMARLSGGGMLVPEAEAAEEKRGVPVQHHQERVALKKKHDLEERFVSVWLAF